MNSLYQTISSPPFLEDSYSRESSSSRIGKIQSGRRGDLKIVGNLEDIESLADMEIGASFHSQTLVRLITSIKLISNSKDNYHEPSKLINGDNKLRNKDESNEDYDSFNQLSFQLSRFNRAAIRSPSLRDSNLTVMDNSPYRTRTPSRFSQAYDMIQENQAIKRNKMDDYSDQKSEKGRKIQRFVLAKRMSLNQTVITRDRFNSDCRDVPFDLKVKMCDKEVKRRYDSPNHQSIDHQKHQLTPKNRGNENNKVMIPQKIESKLNINRSVDIYKKEGNEKIQKNNKKVDQCKSPTSYGIDYQQIDDKNLTQLLWEYEQQKKNLKSRINLLNQKIDSIKNEMDTRKPPKSNKVSNESKNKNRRAHVDSVPYLIPQQILSNINLEDPNIYQQTNTTTFIPTTTNNNNKNKLKEADKKLASMNYQEICSQCNKYVSSVDLKISKEASNAQIISNLKVIQQCSPIYKSPVISINTKKLGLIRSTESSENYISKKSGLMRRKDNNKKREPKSSKHKTSRSLSYQKGSRNSLREMKEYKFRILDNFQKQRKVKRRSYN